MLIVSTFFDYGNKLAINQHKGGCVGFSEETKFQQSILNFDLYKDSEIGCCNDFAYMTASFLNYLEIDNEYVIMPGHIANLVYIKNQEYYVDSNTNLIIKNFRHIDKGKIFYIYPHPNVSELSERFTVLNFQNKLIEDFSAHTHFILNFLRVWSYEQMDTHYLN